MKITIDTAAVAHAIRRWWWARRGLRLPGRCVDCGKRLTTDEITYYGNACNQCEGVSHQAPDAALRADEPPAPCPSWGRCTYPRCGHFLDVLHAAGAARRRGNAASAGGAQVDVRYPCSCNIGKGAYCYRHRITSDGTVQTCRFPDCGCPMDPGPEPDWCARGLPHARPAGVSPNVGGLPR